MRGAVALHPSRPLLGLLAGMLAACGGGDPLPDAPGAGADTGFQPAGDETARVADVVDGETLRLADGRRVRLLGVDAPTGGEACAAEAAAYLGALTLGELIELDICRTPPSDQLPPADGVTAYVVVPRKSFVNLEMLRSGRARYQGTVGRCGGGDADLRLEAGQTEAVEAQRGVFGRDACAAEPPPPKVPAPRPTPTPAVGPPDDPDDGKDKDKGKDKGKDDEDEDEDDEDEDDEDEDEDEDD